MSAQLDIRESPGHALLRACRYHARKSLAGLKKADQPEAVHEVRKEIKRLRAIFRLTRSGLGRKAYRETAKVMRLAAKPLSAPRDARVMRKAFESLAGKKSVQFAELQLALGRLSDREVCNFQNHDSNGIAKYLLKQVGIQLDGLKLRSTRWAEIRNCLARSYTCGRDAYQQAMLKPTPENFHEWRKHVKNYWYQLDFVCPAWPQKTKKLLRDLEKLSDQLGNDHDLVLLSQFACEQYADHKKRAGFQQLIDTKRHEYGKNARHIGSRLYAELPKSVCDQLEKDWKSWRKGR